MDKWYDISGIQTFNGQEQGIFASILAPNKDSAISQFYKRFPYGRIVSVYEIK